MIEKISDIKKRENAIIIAHNYQIPEVQEIADFVGDSLELSRIAKKSKASTIIFAGVRFMAETAKILSPYKTILLPVKDAGCPMADQVSADDVKELRKKYPDAGFVAYINTTAEVKSEVDICCTSANAVKIINSLKQEKIVFLPDKNLANWVALQTEKEIISYDGFCYVHQKFNMEEIINIRKTYPDAELLVHPESPPSVVKNADYVLSTSGILNHAKHSHSKRFIIGTESGLIHRLIKENPDKEFYSPGEDKICFNMKKTTLIDIYNSLTYKQYKIELPFEVLERAKKPIERMVKL
jgi:quinolinate synthase